MAPTNKVSLNELKNCSYCNKKVVTSVQCSICKKQFHPSCASQSKLLIMKEDSSVCTTCLKQSEVINCENNKIEDNKSVCNSDGLTVARMMSVIQELQKSVDFMSSKFDSILQENIELKKLVKENLSAVKKVNELEAQIELLNNKINIIEQRSRLDNIEIHGIPSTPNENLQNVVIKIGELNNVNVDENDLIDVHRLPTGKNQDHPGIIVQFRNKKIRNQYYVARKTSQVYGDDIDIRLPHLRIFVNENLTSLNRKLYNLARKLKTDKGYKYVWTREGSVFVRKDEKGPALRIQKEEDLNKII